MNVPIFYTKKPVFGFDIGHGTVKLMQIVNINGQSTVNGYGYIGFDPQAIKGGVIVNGDEIAKQVYALVTKHLVGRIESKRVIASLPAASTFNRTLLLPVMDDKELDTAVTAEASQYIPLPVDELYIDHEIAARVGADQMEVLMVAAPKKVVDSYVALFDMLGLEVSTLETSIHAVSRIVRHADRTGLPTLIIDFGSIATDLSVIDETVKITGSMDGGGETMTELIAGRLGISQRQAYGIKTNHGLELSKHQSQVLEAIRPLLDKLLTEVLKMKRYYEERSPEKRKIEQIIILGGGANLPGLSTFLTDSLRLPTKLVNPWQNLSFGDLQPPHKLETTLYTTAAGLSLVEEGF